MKLWIEKNSREESIKYKKKKCLPYYVSLYNSCYFPKTILLYKACTWR